MVGGIKIACVYGTWHELRIRSRVYSLQRTREVQKARVADKTHDNPNNGTPEPTVYTFLEHLLNSI